MSAEEQLQAMVDQTIDMALMNVEAYYQEIEASNEILKINDPKEFVFGYCKHFRRTYRSGFIYH